MIDKVVSVQDIVVSPIRDNDDPMKDADYEETKAAIIQLGILRPLLVREGDDGKYVLIDGLKRLHIAKNLGQIMVSIRIMDKADVDRGLLEMKLTAGIQKIRTRPVEYARALLRLLTINKDLTKQELAKKLGMTVETLDKKLKFNDLIPVATDLVDEHKINQTNAYNLATLPKETQKRFLIDAQSLDAGTFCHKVQKELGR